MILDRLGEVYTEITNRLIDVYVYIRYRKPKQVAAGALGFTFSISIVAMVLLFGNLWTGLLAGLTSLPTIALLLYAAKGTVVLYQTQDILRGINDEVEGSENIQKIEEYSREMIREYKTDWFGPHVTVNPEDIEFQWYTENPEVQPGRSDIICLKESSKEAENKASVALDYCEQAITNNFEYYINDQLKCGILYFVALDIAKKSDNEEMAQEIKQDQAPHRIESEEVAVHEALEKYAQIQTIRQEGFFASVLLGECSRLTDTDPADLVDAYDEVDDLLESLVDLQQEMGNMPIEPEGFDRNIISCKILLIHRQTDVIQMRDRIISLIGGEDYEIIYLLAIGRAIYTAEKVEQIADEEIPGVRHIQTDTYSLETDEGEKTRYYAQLQTVRS